MCVCMVYLCMYNVCMYVCYTVYVCIDKRFGVIQPQHPLHEKDVVVGLLNHYITIVCYTPMY